MPEARHRLRDAGMKGQLAIVASGRASTEELFLVRQMAALFPSAAVDIVGRPIDIDPVSPETVLDSADYAALIQPFLRAEAFVNLLHCHSGEPYTAQRGGGGQVPSVAGQVNDALPADVTVVGVIGCTDLGFIHTDRNRNRRIDRGEPVIFHVPRPEDPGNNLEVNQ